MQDIVQQAAYLQKTESLLMHGEPTVVALGGQKRCRMGTCLQLCVLVKSMTA